MDFTRKQVLALGVIYLDQEWLKENWSLAYKLGFNEDLPVSKKESDYFSETLAKLSRSGPSSLGRDYIEEKALKEVGNFSAGQLALNLAKLRLWTNTYTIESLRGDIDWESESELMKIIGADSKKERQDEIRRWTVDAIGTLLRYGFPEATHYEGMGINLEEHGLSEDEIKKLALFVAGFDNQWLKKERGVSYSLEFLDLDFEPEISREFRKRLRMLADENKYQVSIDLDSYREKSFCGYRLDELALEAVKFRLYKMLTNMESLRGGIMKMTSEELRNGYGANEHQLVKFTVTLIGDLLKNGYQTAL